MKAETGLWLAKVRVWMRRYRVPIQDEDTYCRALAEALTCWSEWPERFNAWVTLLTYWPYDVAVPEIFYTFQEFRKYLSSD